MFRVLGFGLSVFLGFEKDWAFGYRFRVLGFSFFGVSGFGVEGCKGSKDSGGFF